MRAILPDERSLDCNSIAWETKRVVIEVSSTRSTAACPCCGQLSERVHSRYVRTLADLPWQGWEVELHWHCRRFFCTNANCRQRIFTERLPEVAAPHARRTCRLGIILNALAFACGGEEGARLAKRLGIRSSPDTLLREIRRTAEEDYPPVRFLGVDDWAMRRGQRYGTILVDLERHRPIDLLPERSAEAFANWLQVHPEVVVISRDRGDCYIKGAGEGAPQAIQVADRWHLLHNMQEALVLTVDRHRSQLKEVAQQMQRSAVEEPPADPLPEPPLPRAPMAPAKAKQASGERRERRLQRFEQVKELHARGVGVREIARQMHMHRRTVRRWIGRETFPERAIRSPRRQVDAWREYLQRRWAEGCRNARTLTAELKTEGYKGSYDMVRRCVASWRQTGCLERRRPSCPGPRVPVHCDSPTAIAWALMKSATEEEGPQQTLARLFRAACPEVDQAVQLALEFRRLVTERGADRFDQWMAAATAEQAAQEIARFAAGLRPDLAAVRAALSLPWSNGQTEGQVNRLKRIKRQMYGRASFDLLRRRVLARTG